MLPQDLLDSLRQLSERFSSLLAIHADSINEKMLYISQSTEIASRLVWIYRNYRTADPVCLELINKACEGLLFLTYPQNGVVSRRFFDNEPMDLYSERLKVPELVHSTLQLLMNLSTDIPEFASRLCAKGIYLKIIQRFALSMPEKLVPYLNFFHSTIVFLPKSDNLKSMLRQLYLTIADKCVDNPHLTEDQITKSMETIASSWYRSGDESVDLVQRPKFFNLLKSYVNCFDEVKYKTGYKLLLHYSTISDCVVSHELPSYSMS